MVFKVAGYKFSFEQVRTWMEKQGVKHSDMQDYQLEGELEELFEQRDIQYIYPLTTCHTARNQIILMVRRNQEDPRSTAWDYKPFVENAKDRFVKKHLLEETGMKDEDLEWVTIADPYFQEHIPTA